MVLVVVARRLGAVATGLHVVPAAGVLRRGVEKVQRALWVGTLLEPLGGGA